MRHEVNIRVGSARAEDAEGIVRVHFAAVHNTAAPFYPDEVIQNWSRPVSEERVQGMRQVIAQSEEIVVVARVDDAIAGFGSIVPANNELRAVYVHPDYGAQGIGGAILSTLEEIARAKGMPLLEMSASVNAESFYRKHGFQVIERTSHQLSSGHQMACVRMRKVLIPSGA
jgi:putative acetyltransferase